MGWLTTRHISSATVTSTLGRSKRRAANHGCLVSGNLGGGGLRRQVAWGNRILARTSIWVTNTEYLPGHTASQPFSSRKPTRSSIPPAFVSSLPAQSTRHQAARTVATKQRRPVPRPASSLLEHSNHRANKLRIDRLEQSRAARHRQGGLPNTTCGFGMGPSGRQPAQARLPALSLIRVAAAMTRV